MSKGTDKLNAKFKRQVKALNKTIAEYKEHYPHSNAYLADSGTLCILEGDDSDVSNMELGSDNEIISVDLNADHGGF